MIHVLKIYAGKIYMSLARFQDANLRIRLTTCPTHYLFHFKDLFYYELFEIYLKILSGSFK